MSKEYIRKTPKDYALPPSLYMRVLSTVRDYPRMKESISDVLYGGSSAIYNDEFAKKNKDGKIEIKRAIMPKAKHVGKVTENKALKIAQTSETIKAIDDALQKIPQEYRKYIFENIIYKKPYPYYAHRNTWSKWKGIFLYFVADELGWL